MSRPPHKERDGFQVERTPRIGRVNQIVAWTVASIFILGFFLTPVGYFTGPVLGAWFVGTQRVRRGFAWMVIFGLVLGAPGMVRGAFHAGHGAPAYLGWAVLLMVLGILPLTLHRITNSHLPGYAWTLPFPVYAALLAVSEKSFLSVSVRSAHGDHIPVLLTQTGSILGPAGPAFFTCWFAATLVWAWNREFRTEENRLGMGIFAAACVAVVGVEAMGRMRAHAANQTLAVEIFNWLCLAAGVWFAVGALLSQLRNRGWQCRPETLRILKSPATGEPLKLEGEGRKQALVSDGGERFPIRDGIVDLRRPEDLSGDNGKYNHLYETIGGFYDDIQRVVCAFQGFDGVGYVMSYMSLLEVKPGDSVLETSVGTGLNFKYLPKGVKLTGLDLSPEMLVNCQTKMQRWGLDADLFMGNAESLPFADASFDVVFHVGGINFFNDRAKAIAEMIRVAKPGSLILIADETEEHVKEMYEQGPVTSRFYKNRREPVVAPAESVPAEMQEKRLEFLKPMGKNRFYALTFRKPVGINSQMTIAQQHPQALPFSR